jgi:adenosylcobinamide-GDP ribazoletransferase
MSRPFLFAISFLTRFPVPVNPEYDEKLPSASTAYYPLVGAIIGLLLCLVDKLAGMFLPVTIVNTLILIALIYLTGGLHLDGFMDSIDGFFSGREKKQVLEIMHDSKVGAFGVIALMLLFLLKFNLLMELKGTIRTAGLILMPTMSRWMILFSAYRYPVAGLSNLAKSFTNYIGLKEVYTGFAWLVAVLLSLHYLLQFPYLSGLLIFLLSWIVTIIISKIVIKKIEGLTGDVYGMINEIIEVIVLLFLLLGMRY